MVTPQLFLFRHGETAWSLTGQHTGRTDIPLTENGERSAANLRDRVQSMTFAHVLTSPLQRARRTCELAGLGAVARLEPDLQEWDYGDYEGQTTAAIRVSRPEWNVFEEGCPGGESVDQMAQRVDRLVEAIRALSGKVALFSHGHLLRALAVRWVGLPIRQGQHFALDTGSISVLGYEYDNLKFPSIRLWNAMPDVFRAG